jgi:hypothetical protein
MRQSASQINMENQTSDIFGTAIRCVGLNGGEPVGGELAVRASDGIERNSMSK